MSTEIGVKIEEGGEEELSIQLFNNEENTFDKPSDDNMMEGTATEQVMESYEVVNNLNIDKEFDKEFEQEVEQEMEKEAQKEVDNIQQAIEIDEIDKISVENVRTVEGMDAEVKEEHIEVTDGDTTEEIMEPGELNQGTSLCAYKYYSAFF